MILWVFRRLIVAIHSKSRSDLTVGLMIVIIVVSRTSLNGFRGREVDLIVERSGRSSCRVIHKFHQPYSGVVQFLIAGECVLSVIHSRTLTHALFCLFLKSCASTESLPSTATSEVFWPYSAHCSPASLLLLPCVYILPIVASKSCCADFVLDFDVGSG